MERYIIPESIGRVCALITKNNPSFMLNDDVMRNTKKSIHIITNFFVRKQDEGRKIELLNELIRGIQEFGYISFSSDDIIDILRGYTYESSRLLEDEMR